MPSPSKCRVRAIVSPVKPIAYIHSDFSQKFGIPRQSGLVDSLEATIVFCPEYANPAALKGLDGFSHLWLIWEFDGAKRSGWSPTVRPPRLGGRERMGVFATRSPFRPNSLGLSCVRLKGIEYTDEGPVIHVLGADLRDGTPIFDIKPYLPYADCHPDATGGFTDNVHYRHLQVIIPDELLSKVPAEKREALIGVLQEDPRPPLQQDPDKVFSMAFADLDVHFTVKGDELPVVEVQTSVDASENH